MRIYAIRNLTNGTVKIGTSLDPAVRIKNLSQQFKHLGIIAELVLVGSAPIGNPHKWMEFTVHDALRDGRVMNEWFRSGHAEVEDFITNVIILNPNDRHLMKVSTWLYRKGLLPEAWQPKGAESNHEIAWRMRLQRRKETLDTSASGVI